MSPGITRRDFLNATALGAGALLLELPSPARLLAQPYLSNDYGGVGDYAASHGNTGEVTRIFNDVRSGRYDSPPAEATDTEETFDLVVVGGGLGGLSAAYHFKKVSSPGQKCLIIENHPMFGGQAKRNEFMVNGQRLIGPQASNSFGILDRPGLPGYEIYSELGIPTNFEYQPVPPGLEGLQFDRTNYGYKLWFDAPSIGYFFDRPTHGVEPQWSKDIWRKKLRETPFSKRAKRDFLLWRGDRKDYYRGKHSERWLDTLTYKDYLEKVMGLSPEVTSFADPIMASTIGLGCDAISAYGAYQISMPGFQRFRGHRVLKDSHWHSFPGGNDGFSRYFIKALIPDAIGGAYAFEDIHNSRVNFRALDRKGNKVRIRLGAMAVRVEHDSRPERSEYVSVTYVKGGKAYRLRARSVVMAVGSWASRHVVRDLSEELREAFGQLFHSPMLVANVAVTNWRFLRKLGLTACRWFDGFGFGLNIRRQMVVGDYRPPLDPSKPSVLSFYVPFYYPGLPVKEQGDRGREELLSTSYYDYELRIRKQMVRLFGMAGFDPKKDIAGIVLNRWTHGYVNPQPGFYFGGEEGRAPRDVIRARFGRIAFCHAELNGHQHWVSSVEEGRRAAEQVLRAL